MTTMASTLQRQLAALAAPASSLLRPERKRTSIIFSSEEASKYDRDTYYKIGLDGLNELIAVCPDLFSPFAHSVLFSNEGKHFERAVEDATTNEKVDELVEKFLITVSPYLMLKSALKCMEWLVYRFHIEHFNVESIMECIMPYYDTLNFVMIIQAIQLGGRDSTSVNWEWLTPSIQSGTALRKATLYGNVNGPFVLWLFQTLKKFIKVHHLHQDNLSSYLGFMVSTIVGVVTKFSREFSMQRQYHNIKGKRTVIDVTLNQIHTLFEEILENEKYTFVRNNREVYSTAYVMIATIGITAEENPEIGGILGSKIKRIFNLLIKNRDVILLEETYMLIEMLVQHIYFEWTFKKKALLKKTLNDLSIVSREWDVSKVTSRLILANTKNEGLLSPEMLFEYLAVIQLPPQARAEILCKVYFTYKEHCQRWAEELLTKFEREYPCEFELACQKDDTFASDLSSVKTGKNLMLLVEHPDEQLRTKAVRKLIGQATKDDIKKGVSKKPSIKTQKSIVPDQNPIAQALLARFNDESQSVLGELLKPKIKELLKIFSAGTILENCISVLKRNRKVKTSRLAVKKLCALASKFASDETIVQQVMKAVIPFLFPHKASGTLTAMKIIKSPFAKKNQILRQYKSLTKRDDEVSAEEICSITYRFLSSMKDSSQLCVFGSTNAVEVTISLLMLKREHDLPQLLSSAMKVGVHTTSEFPVTTKGFGECLALAKSKNKVSIQLILSMILNINVSRFLNKVRVVKYVWDLGETANHRGTCMNFLKVFLQKICHGPNHQFWLWLATLIETSTIREEDQDPHDEFYLIRCMQFFTAYIKGSGIPASTNSKKETNYVTEDSDHKSSAKRLTRSQGSADDELSSKSNKSGKDSSKAKGSIGSSISPTWCLLEVLLSKCIQHHSLRVRTLCVKFLEVIKNVPNLSVDWEDLLKRVLLYRHEIIADNSQAASLIGKAIVDAKLSRVRSEIIKALTSKETNRGIFTGLVNICQHTGSLLYTELEPMMKALIETDPNSSQLLALLNCFEASPRSLELIPKLLDNKGCAKVLLKKLNYLLYGTADKSFKKQLFHLMINSAVECKIPEVKLGIQRCVRKWEVESSVISEELKKCVDAERRVSVAVAKKSRGGEGMEEISSWSGRAEVILEFVQGMKQLTDSKELLGPLFRILKICISLEEQSPVEYLKQLTLTALTLCCAEETDDGVHDGSFQVELVIDCLRCSRNPQTHHHALILLNYAAKRFHEQVLHGVMSLFTFMGNSILRQDDTYSTQLIQQTVTTIVPALTKTARGNEIGRMVVSGGIFRVFTSALQDIPVHRRLPVLTSLVETLNPEECLWQLLIIIIDNALNRDRKRSNLNADLELAVDLAWHYGHRNVIKSLSSIYEFFISISSTVFKNSVSDQELGRLKRNQSPVEKAVFDFSRKETYRDIQIVIYYTLELMMKIACKFSDDDTEDMIEYDLLLERCLAFSRVVSGLKDNKIFRLVTQRNLEVIEKINAVLEAEDFIRVISVILERNDMSIQRKILDMFNLRLAQKVEWFGDLNTLLPLLEPLIQVSKTDPTSEEIVTLVQTSFLSMKLIAKHLAFMYPEDFVDVFQLALSYSTHENHLLCASALLCLGELFCLKSLLLPNLSDVTSAILRAFKASSKMHAFGKELQENMEVNHEKSSVSNVSIDNSVLEQTSSRQEGDTSVTTAHLLCISTIACMNKMVEQLGPLIGSKFMKKALVLLLTIDTQLSSRENSTSQRKKTFDQRLRALLKTIATKIPVRNSLLPLKATFHSLLDKPKALKSIMIILKDALQATAKQDFVLILPSLCDSFMEEFLGCRHNMNALEPEENDQEISLVEDSILDCLITGAVLKMSEGAFRPYYHKLFDWARESDAKLITFYRFSAAAAERLKSLFVTFAGYVVNEAVDSLNKESVELIKSILSLFFHLFSNDREGFVTTDRFNALAKPLVDLMESENILGGQIELNMLSNCLIQLAVASNDLNRWQHMMDLVSTKAHHHDKHVRMNVISIFEAAANELGKDFLPLLPPVVPFLAELMNDDEPEVEAATQKMLLKLESIVGEPLQSYFT